MKLCTRCRELKSLTDFGKNRSNKDGLQTHCKSCRSAHYTANAEKVRKRVRDYVTANAETISERRKGYHAVHREANNARSRKWREDNPAMARESDRRGGAKWRSDNPDKQRANFARYRARKLGAAHEPYSRREIFERWGSRCCYCDAPANSLDHVIPLIAEGADAPNNLVPSCVSCNSSKGSKSLADWALKF